MKIAHKKTQTGLTGRWGTHGGQNLAHDREIDGGAQAGADLLARPVSRHLHFRHPHQRKIHRHRFLAQGNGGQRLHRRDPRRAAAPDARACRSGSIGGGHRPGGAPVRQRHAQRGIERGIFRPAAPGRRSAHSAGRRRALARLCRRPRTAHARGQPVQPDPRPGPGQLLHHVAGDPALSRTAGSDQQHARPGAAAGHGRRRAAPAHADPVPDP